jgi:MFS family permease
MLEKVEEEYHILVNQKCGQTSQIKENLTDSSLHLSKIAYDSVKVFDLLHIAGDNKKFQICTMVILSFMSFAMAFLVYSPPFLFYEPKFYCFDENMKSTLCEEIVACSNKYKFEVRSDRFSAVDEFELYCDKSYLTTYSKSIIFFAAATPTMFLSMLSDYFGRRPVMISSFFFLLIGSSISYFATSFYTIVFGLCLSYIGSDILFSISSIYTSEIIGSDMRNMANGITFFFFGFGGIVLFVVNIWISNYRTIFFILIAFSVIGIGASIWFIETPYVYHKQRNLKKLYETLCYINEVNHKDNQNLLFDKREEIRRLIFQDLVSHEFIQNSYSIVLSAGGIEEKKGALDNIFSINFKTGLTIFMLNFIFMNIYIGYNMSVLTPASMGIDNIYLNGILLGISEIVGYLMIITIAHKTPRRTLNIFNSASMIGFSFILLYISHFDSLLSESVKRIIETLISVVMKLILCMNFTLVFNYCNELVETKLRGFALGISVFCGRASTSVVSVLEMEAKRFHIHPMAAASIPAFIALPICFMLPETLNKPIQN